MKTLKLIIVAAISILIYNVSIAQDHSEAITKKVKTEKGHKCEMKGKATASAAYSCPMKCEGDKMHTEAGSCSKCGMALTAAEGAKKKSCCADKKTAEKGHKCGAHADASAAKSFSCPMKCEGDKTHTEAGSCSKCGMALTVAEGAKKKSCCADAKKKGCCADSKKEEKGKGHSCGMMKKSK